MLGRKYTPGFDESKEVVFRENIFNKNGIEIKIL